MTFMGLLAADRSVRKAEGERLSLVKMPTSLDHRRCVVVLVVVGRERRVYGLKHRVFPRATPAFSLGDYENLDVTAGASYIVRSFLDKCPIPLDQPSKTPPDLLRIGQRYKEKEKKCEHPSNEEVEPEIK